MEFLPNQATPSAKVVAIVESDFQEATTNESLNKCCLRIYRNILSSQISYSPNRSAITRKSSDRSKKFTNINYLNGQNMTLVFMIKIDIVRQNFERSWKNTFFCLPCKSRNSAKSSRSARKCLISSKNIFYKSFYAFHWEQKILMNFCSKSIRNIKYMREKQFFLDILLNTRSSNWQFQLAMHSLQ